MEAIANIDGKICSSAEAKVSVFDRGFLFGDGVYETGRSFDRCLVFLDEHLRRLRTSAGKLGIPVPWSDEELTKRLVDTAQAFGKPNVAFRLVVTRGIVEKIGLEVETEAPTCVILMQPIADTLKTLRNEGYYLRTSKILRNSALAQDPNIKTSNYLNSLLALREVKAQGAMDAILLDAKGQVTEGTTFSVFSVSPTGLIRTPSLEVGILDSITRRHILTIAKKTFTVEEGFYPVAEFQKASEVFIVSSVREVCPVNRWDETRYPCPGPIAKQLQESFTKEIARYAEGHPRF